MKRLLKEKWKNGEINTLNKGGRALLEAEVASIARKMNSISAVQNIYFDEVPEGFSYPSFYFPPVEQTTKGDTLLTFAYDNVLFIKVFAKSTKAAMQMAHAITHSISREKNLIPIVNEDGTYSTDKLRLKNISFKSVETGAAQIYVRWHSVHEYLQPTYSKTANHIFNLSIKEEL